MTDTARYHGAFFCLLLEKFERPVAFRKIRGAGSGLYVIDEAVAVSLKLSTKRTGPWTFTFAPTHQRTLRKLQRAHRDVFVCFICGGDGIAGLSMEELAAVFADKAEDQQWISVRRRLRSMYEIAGKRGAHASRVGGQTVFERLVEAVAGSGAT